MVTGENYSAFIVLIHKELRTIIAMITENKVIELFCMSDDFCKLFDTQMAKNHIRHTNTICHTQFRITPDRSLENMLFSVLFLLFLQQKIKRYTI